MDVEKMRNHALLVLGVAVCLTAAALMAFGEGVSGENHTGIATVIGIVGIGLVSTSTATSAPTSSTEAPKKQKSSAGGVLFG